MTEEDNFKKLTKCWMCDIDYWYFWSKNLSYEPYLCNGCHDFLQETTNFNDVAFVSIKGSDYRTHFVYMSKGDAIKIILI